jgi:hypothetical protein
VGAGDYHGDRHAAAAPAHHHPGPGPGHHRGVAPRPPRWTGPAAPAARRDPARRPAARPLAPAPPRRAPSARHGPAAARPGVGQASPAAQLEPSARDHAPAARHSQQRPCPGMGGWSARARPAQAPTARGRGGVRPPAAPLPPSTSARHASPGTFGQFRWRENGTVDGPRCPACGAELRQCPVCGTVITARPGRGRPRVYCTDSCRWRRGHAAARQRAAASVALTLDELVGQLAARSWPGFGHQVSKPPS